MGVVKWLEGYFEKKQPIRFVGWSNKAKSALATLSSSKTKKERNLDQLAA